MLTESSYLTGLVVYVVAGLFILWLMHRWLLRGLAPWLRLLILLPMAALLLTPAYTEPGADTMAPALVVAAFQFMTAGAEGAQHALQPLGALVAIALALALLAAAVLALLNRRG